MCVCVSVCVCVCVCVCACNSVRSSLPPCLSPGVERTRGELEEAHAEQMAEMERRLNDARREHTKAGEGVRVD